MKSAHIFDDISIRSAGSRLTKAIVITSIPLKIAVGRRVDQFTPPVVNENLEVVSDEKREDVEVLIF